MRSTLAKLRKKRNNLRGKERILSSKINEENLGNLGKNGENVCWENVKI